MVFLSLLTCANAQELVRYDFPGSSFAPTQTAPGVVAFDIDDIGSLASIAPGTSLPDSIFLQFEVLSTDAQQAVANDQFFQLTIAPTNGEQVSFSELIFDIGRGGPSTPRGWVIRSSIDNFLNDIDTAVVPSTQPALTTFSVDLISSEFQMLNSPTTFRFYGYGPSAGNVGLFFDNIRFQGSSTAIPEPSTSLLPLLSLICLLRRTRRAAA